jgi:hypothetical protein
VSQLDSLLITPEAISFQAKVVINNQMRGDLSIDKVDWSAALHDNPLIDDSFTKLNRMRSRGEQTVTVPFQIPMADVVKQAVDVLAEEGVRVGFKGAVHPAGFEPVPFEATRTIPIPKMPLVSIARVEGSPLEGAFTLLLNVTNTNSFPISVASVDSHLVLNGKKYDLLQSEGASKMAPGAAGRVALTMQQTRGKSLSMALNVIQSKGSSRFVVGGSISCATPHGLIRLPLSLRSE